MGKRKQTFTDQIRRAVDDCGLSRYAICKRIGLDKAVMSRFMNGKGFLAERTLNNLAALIGLAVVAGEIEKQAS